MIEALGGPDGLKGVMINVQSTEKKGMILDDIAQTILRRRHIHSVGLAIEAMK